MAEECSITDVALYNAVRWSAERHRAAASGAPSPPDMGGGGPEYSDGDGEWPGGGFAGGWAGKLGDDDGPPPGYGPREVFEHCDDDDGGKVTIQFRPPPLTPLKHPLKQSKDSQFKPSTPSLTLQPYPHLSAPP